MVRLFSETQMNDGKLYRKIPQVIDRKPELKRRVKPE